MIFKFLKKYLRGITRFVMVVFAIYYANLAFQFSPFFPDPFSGFTKIIYIFTAIFLVIGAIYFVKKRKFMKV